MNEWCADNDGWTDDAMLKPGTIKLKILPKIETKGMTSDDVAGLADKSYDLMRSVFLGISGFAPITQSNGPPSNHWTFPPQSSQLPTYGTYRLGQIYWHPYGAECSILSFQNYLNGTCNLPQVWDKWHSKRDIASNQIILPPIKSPGHFSLKSAVVNTV